MSRRPNVVIFNPDQFRADAVAHLGNPASSTPVLDRLAREDAVSFRLAFCQNPVCTPSRCSYMTGWYPHVRGHRTMFHMLRPDEPILLEGLMRAGYRVWWGGKNDLAPGQLGWSRCCHERALRRPGLRPNLHAEQGWRGEPGGDNWYSFFAGRLETAPGEPYRDGDWDVVEQAADWIRGYRREEPFCLFLSLGAPHPPYGVEEPWYGAVDRSRVPARVPTPAAWERLPSIMRGLVEGQGLMKWSEERWTDLRATYLGMCSRVDSLLGLVIDALKRRGVYDDTALFFFSDHGDYTGDYGIVEKTQNTFQDCLSRVPFVIKPPRGLPARPRVSEALVELIDFSATVEAIAGLTPGHTHFGRSLLPVLAGDTDEHRDAVFCEGGRLRGERHCMELESIEHQHPEGLYYPRLRLQRGEGPEHTKAVMCRTRRHKLVMRLYERDELYDLDADPAELDNRVDDSALSAVHRALVERVARFYLETADVVPHDIDDRGFSPH